MKLPSKSNFFLYAAYTSTCLEDRAWSFCVSLCMSLLGGMRMVSIEQLAEGLGQMIFSGHLGKAFDQCDRKTAIRIVVPLNNFTIVAAAAFFIGCLSVDSNSGWFPALLVLGMTSSAINRLFLNAEKFLVGRDWVVVIAEKNLSDLNAILTSLDQLVNVISPLLTGLLVSLCGLRTTCAIFGIGSLVSMASKVFFLTSLYNMEPTLHEKQKTFVEAGGEKQEQQDDSQKEPSNCLRSLFSVLSCYYNQTIFAAALGMALLFMTVLGFDGLAVGYGQSIGLPESLLGGFRSFGSAMGIAGALSYAFVEKRLGVRTTGLVGLTCQQICLILAVVSIWLPGSPMDLKEYFSIVTFHSWWDELVQSFNGNSSAPVESHFDWKHFTADGNSMDSIFAFLIGIATARFGLWMGDLSITHIMQVNVAESQRNTVFGVHNALCQTFSVMKDLLVISFPDPSTFGLCILISYGFVCTGYASFIFYLIKHPDRISPTTDALSHSEDKSNVDNLESSINEEMLEVYEERL